MTAPDLSPAERAVVERFEAAEPAPESWEVRNAVADFLRNWLWEAHNAPLPRTPGEAADELLAAMRGERP